MMLNFDEPYSATRDYVVIDTQPADVAAITAAFDADTRTTAPPRRRARGISRGPLAPRRRCWA